MEQICFNFLNSYSEFDAIELLQTCRYLNLNHLGMFLGKFLEKQFPYSINVKKNMLFHVIVVNNMKKRLTFVNESLI